MSPISSFCKYVFVHVTHDLVYCKHIRQYSTVNNEEYAFLVAL